MSLFLWKRQTICSVSNGPFSKRTYSPATFTGPAACKRIAGAACRCPHLTDPGNQAGIDLHQQPRLSQIGFAPAAWMFRALPTPPGVYGMPTPRSFVRRNLLVPFIEGPCCIWPESAKATSVHINAFPDVPWMRVPFRRAAVTRSCNAQDTLRGL